ncbi:MAG: ABC transporter permease, partial [Chloroflexi bacterium]|nr:ABC transporter permease [Chloroflexota bacterium]
MYTQGQPITGLPPAFRWIGTGVVAGIPVPIFLTLLVFAAGWIFLSRTKYGAQIYLMGDNLNAAKLAGAAHHLHHLEIVLGHQAEAGHGLPSLPTAGAWGCPPDPRGL